MCKVCEKQEPIGTDDDLIIKIKGDKLSLAYSGYSCDSDFYRLVKINYCPSCGTALRGSTTRTGDR